MLVKVEMLGDIDSSFEEYQSFTFHPVSEITGKLTGGMIVEQAKGKKDLGVKFVGCIDVLLKVTCVVSHKKGSRGKMVRCEYNLVLIVVHV